MLICILGTHIRRVMTYYSILIGLLPSIFVVLIFVITLILHIMLSYKSP